MFKRLDRAHAEVIIRRLSTLKPDTQPQWGKSTAMQILGHLTDTVLYTSGERPELPFKGNWKTKYVFKPIILNQLKPIPRNVRLPNPNGGPGGVVFRDGTLDEFQGAMDAYLKLAEARKLRSRTHPFFGVLTPPQWLKFHVAHFEHHLTQFGL